MTESAGSPRNQDLPFTVADAILLDRQLAQPTAELPPELTDDEVAKWMEQASTAPDAYTEPVVLESLGGDSEPVNVIDVVYLQERSPNGDLTGMSHPVVVVERPRGGQETLPVRDFLRRSGFDIRQFRAETHQRQLQEQAIALSDTTQLQASEHDARAAELRVRQRRNEHIFLPDRFAERTDLGDPNLVPSEQSVRDAEQTLAIAMQHDEHLAGILGLYRREHLGLHDDTRALVGAIREDTNLRLAIGSHLLDQVNANAKSLPSRIYWNDEKGAAYAWGRGYRGANTMTSREYAALLALRMLDGSFSRQREAGDAVAIDAGGKSGRGQHRFAARVTLGLTHNASAT